MIALTMHVNPEDMPALGRAFEIFNAERSKRLAKLGPAHAAPYGAQQSETPMTDAVSTGQLALPGFLPDVPATLGHPGSPNAEAVVTTVEAQPEAAPAETAPRPRRRRKPRVEESSEPQVVAEIKPADTAETGDEDLPELPPMISHSPVKVAAPTVERSDVEAALKALGEAKGIDAVRNVLNGFDARRVSDLATERYADVLAACKAAA